MLIINLVVAILLAALLTTFLWVAAGPAVAVVVGLMISFVSSRLLFG